MWKRNTKDPLGSLLWNRYKLHVLPRPRSGLKILDVFPYSRGKVSPPGSLMNFLDPSPETPEITYGEILSQISVINSNEVEFGVAFNFLGGFLSASEAIGALTELNTVFNRYKVNKIRFRIDGATRDFADPFSLERRLRKTPFNYEDSLMKKSSQYFVTIAVHRSDQISFSALDSRSKTVKIKLGSKLLGTTNVKFKKIGANEINITGNSSLVYGVELNELIYNKRRSRLELDVTRNIIQVMGGKDKEIPGTLRSMIGTSDDSMILPLDD